MSNADELHVALRRAAAAEPAADPRGWLRRSAAICRLAALLTALFAAVVFVQGASHGLFQALVLTLLVALVAFVLLSVARLNDVVGDLYGTIESSERSS
mgnify:CR=1 FL=1